jgi:hypothetical protein
MTSATSTAGERASHELAALDGSNLLAFMSALGVVRILAVDQPSLQPTLRWEFRSAWRPIIECGCDRAALLGILTIALQRSAGLPELRFADNIKQTPEQFRALARCAAASSERLERLAWLASFASDACVDRHSAEGMLADTAFRTMQGAGHQHFLKSIRENFAAVRAEDLEADLFGVWKYDRKGSPLRWDPADDRQHAYRWRDPSSDKPGAVVGALALAGAALPMFPTSPRQGGLLTLGFQGSREGPLFTWPVWSPALRARSLQSLLALAELQRDAPPRAALQALGVLDVFRCRRVSVGKMRNFTPAWCP